MKYSGQFQRPANWKSPPPQSLSPVQHARSSSQASFVTGSITAVAIAVPIKTTSAMHANEPSPLPKISNAINGPHRPAQQPRSNRRSSNLHAHAAAYQRGKTHFCDISDVPTPATAITYTNFSPPRLEPERVLNPRSSA